ncbi:FAD-dependent oxidoreductase [Nocardioides sp. URHA0032]|uniref:FAD-dependent oxidoreductase n=1 Tax=Nocardioides sp. URHA0032 TaxID=1380388 RepID=UPI00048AA787|nr:FAD-dependent oxidoreductase [Nocardioides sp. URHA0032]
MTSATHSYDVVVVGGGHNGLIAAAYLARAGRSVLVLERLHRTGGAARWSPAAALPEELVADLALELRLGPTPPPTDDLARVVLPTLLRPLPLEREVRAQVGSWDELVTTPLDLHHRLRASTPVVVGGGTAVADALDRAIRAAGVEMVTSAGVSGIRAGTDGAEVSWHDGAALHTAAARHVLANVAPWVLAILLGEQEDPDAKPRWDGAAEVPPEDVEREFAMPGGHWYHGDLEWPWAPNRARLDTPAQQWGVQTDLAPVLVCGSGSRRGGGVTGLGGHSAAHAVLAS